MIVARRGLILLLPTVLFGSLSGCSSAPVASETSDAGPTTARAAHIDKAAQEETLKLLTELNTRMQGFETKLSSMNDKLDATRKSIEQLSQEKKNEDSPVITHPSENAGPPIDKSSHLDPETGFINDEPVRTFRKAMILYQGQKYPEAVLAFSEFVEKYPDHVLAGSAQYYVGEAYLKQKEYKLAIQEFQRVLTSYDRSARISDTLASIASAEDSVHRTEDAAKHRQLLTSLFPQSPAGLTIQPEASDSSQTPPSSSSPSSPSPLSRSPRTSPSSHSAPAPSSSSETAPAETKHLPHSTEPEGSSTSTSQDAPASASVPLTAPLEDQPKSGTPVSEAKQEDQE